MKRVACAIVAAIGVSVPLTAVQAAQPQVFNLRVLPLREALVAFAVQAEFSVSAQEAAGCRAYANAVRGRMTADQALARLLANTGCGYSKLDDRSVRIVRLPPPASPTPKPSRLSDAVTTTVDDVLVTATKRTTGLSRAPYALSSVTGQDLADAARPDMEGLASQVSGLTVTNLGPGRNKIFIRGLSDGALSGRAQSMVGLYLDDMRLTYNAPDPDLRLIDVDRVEVLRGPQGSLYGAGSIGGILQIVTRRPDLDAYSGSASVEGAATSGGQPSGVVEGVVNLPLIRDRIALRLAGYREEMGGYIDDEGLGIGDVGQTTRQGMRAALRVRYSPQWTASATVAAQTIHSDDTHYALDALGPRRRANLVREPHRNDFDAASITVEGDLGWSRLKASGSIQNHGVDSVYDASAARPLFGVPGAGPAPFRESIDNHAMMSEVTLASPGSRRLSWIAGFFVSEYASNLATALEVPGEAAPRYREARRDHIDETAIFGEATWSLTERLKVTAGGRWFNLGVETESRVVDAGGDAPFAQGSHNGGFAPKVLASFDASDALLVYVQASEGYRASGFNTSGRVGQAFGDPGMAQPLRRFASDELWNYEAGARLGLFDQRLSLRAAVFRAVWRDIQADQLLPSGLPLTANLGNGHNTGLELEGTFEEGPLRLDANVLFNDPELQRPAPGLAIPGDRGLPGVARFQFGSRARYEIQLNDRLSAVLTAEAAYIGRSQLTFDATTAPEMGDYWTTRVSAALAASSWRFNFWAENLANSNGDTFGYGNPFSVRLSAQNTPQRPRTIGLTVSRAF